MTNCTIIFRHFLFRRIRNKSAPPSPGYRELQLSSHPSIIPVALGRNFPQKTNREDHRQFWRSYVRGSPVRGGLGDPPRHLATPADSPGPARQGACWEAGTAQSPPPGAPIVNIKEVADVWANKRFIG